MKQQHLNVPLPTLPNKTDMKNSSPVEKKRIIHSNRMNPPEIVKYESKPLLTKVPESIHRIKLGSKLRLSCEADGNPTPTVKWIRFGRTFSFNSTLNIEKISAADDGFYECIARNRNGKAAKEIRIIIVGNISPDSNLNDHRDLLEKIIEASKHSKRVELIDLITLNTTD
ncbi:hypothetical protein BLA29_011208, partial [Euroglyphus maynei]